MVIGPRYAVPGLALHGSQRFLVDPTKAVSCMDSGINLQEHKTNELRINGE